MKEAQREALINIAKIAYKINDNIRIDGKYERYYHVNWIPNFYVHALRDNLEIVDDLIRGEEQC